MDNKTFDLLLDSIEIYGNMNKSQLVNCCFDDFGEGETKAELRDYSKGHLLARIIESLYSNE